MADTTTTTYGLTKPEVGASADTWGGKINADLDTLDATVFALNGATLKKASNLSDLASSSTARTSLGLGDAAVKNTGTTSGTLAAGDDSRITGSAQKASNLSDLASAATARTNLGLGGAAVLNVGTGAGTVAAGNDSRFTGSLQAANNLSELTSPATARTNLGLGQTDTLVIGKIGIATASPISKLHIDQAGAVANYATVGNGNNGIQVGVSASGRAGITAYAGDPGITFGHANSTAYVEDMLLSASGLAITGALSVGNAAATRTNLGLGAVENKSSATIRGELTAANVTATGLITAGTAAPSGTPYAGQIYLQYS